ncbi:MAG: histidinol dehydrogenase [Actinomycetota bacterium]
MLRRLDLRGLADPAADLPRPVIDGNEPVVAVREIIADVRHRGDTALLELTARFDGARLDAVRVDPAEVKAALEAIDPSLRQALEVAAERIARFHRAQLREPHVVEDGGVTVRCWDQPLARAGCYVPGGRATYPSTVLMTAVVAQVAGVDEVVLAVPPGPDGHVPQATLAAAAVAGIDEVYAVGGAQAIAALAYGTETIRPCDVIAGPGNIYVAIAKREVAPDVRVAAAFAGPSEVVVVADGTAPPAAAAVDVIVQAEHGPDGLAWLVAWDADAAAAIDAEIDRLVAEAPRADDIRATLSEGGYLALVDGPAAAAAVVDRIAPEHLEVMTAAPDEVVSSVRNAGAIFVGPTSPASVGDYVAGPSHVLPTNATARFGAALSTDDFRKAMHVVEITDAGLAELAPHVAAIADAEGLAAHALSVRLPRSGS